MDIWNLVELRESDWRDKEEYPYGMELSLNKWRWEFLRRRPSYGDDYSRYENEFPQISRDKYFEDQYNLAEVIHPLFGFFKIKEAISIYNKKLGENEDIFIIDSFDDIVRFRDSFISRRMADIYDLPESFKEMQPWEVAIRIDLKKSIKDQIDEILPALKTSQRSWNEGKLIQPRARSEKWPTYIRILDAKSAGASYGDMTQNSYEAY